eukprot:1891973-Amphidinium_carterae.1
MDKARARSHIFEFFLCLGRGAHTIRDSRPYAHRWDTQWNASLLQKSVPFHVYHPHWNVGASPSDTPLSCYNVQLHIRLPKSSQLLCSVALERHNDFNRFESAVGKIGAGDFSVRAPLR